MRLKLEKTPEQIREKFIEARAAAYPSLRDLADAIYWQTNGDSKPMERYLAKVAEVKTRIPKPNE